MSLVNPDSSFFFFFNAKRGCWHKLLVNMAHSDSFLKLWTSLSDLSTTGGYADCHSDIIDLLRKKGSKFTGKVTWG